MSNTVQAAFTAVNNAIGDTSTAVTGKIQTLDAEVSPLTTVPSALAASRFYNGLKISCTTANAVSLTIAAKGLLLSDGSGHYELCQSFLGGANLGIVGANGLDTGVLAANTLYALWVVGDGNNNFDSLLSLSATAPVMPSGFSYKIRVGWFKTDANKNIMPFIQNGADFHFTPIAGSGLTAIPQVGTGEAGDVTVPTWVPIDLTPWVPSTAVAVTLQVRGLGNAVVMAAPNNGYGAYNDAVNPPPVSYIGQGSYQVGLEKLPLESMSIYWASNAGNPPLASNTTGPFGSLGVFGWTDSL